GSKHGKVTSLDIPGCGSSICDLHRGTNASINIGFSTNVTKVTSVVHGILSGIPVPFPLDNPDGCKNSGLACPLPSGKQYKYNTNIFVRNEYPKLRVVIKWELKDQSGEDIICLELPAEIVDAKKSETLKFHPRSLTVL
ncbi:hypothetical protein CAPTEDRAFT_94276, partial [Capitella teleta]